MRKMWKRALAGVLTASMALSLAACGGSSSNGGSSADGSTTLEVWSSNLSDSQRENVKKLVAQYEEQTGVKVNYTEFSYDMLHDKILSAAAGGNTPDVAWGLPEWTGEFHSMGILEDLSDRYANWDDASVLSDAVMKGMSIGDEIIGVPYEMTVRAYLCHENIMKKGGTPATYMELKPLFLFNTSKNNDAAFDFATYVCGKEWQQGVYSSASPRSDVTVPGKWTEDFQALSDNGVAFPPVTLGSISQAMIDSIAKVLQEGMTPQAAAEWLADAVNTSLKESGELSAS